MKDSFFGKAYYNDSILGGITSSNLYSSGEVMVVTDVKGTSKTNTELTIQRVFPDQWPRPVVRSNRMRRRVIKVNRWW